MNTILLKICYSYVRSFVFSILTLTSVCFILFTLLRRAYRLNDSAITNVSYMQYLAKFVVIVVTVHVLLRDVHKCYIIRNMNSIISLGYM